MSEEKLEKALAWRNENSYEDSQRLMGEFISKYNEHPEVTYRKAAQAYADLPEKIEGMRGKCDIACKDYNQALDDILNLLKGLQND